VCECFSHSASWHCASCPGVTNVLRGGEMPGCSSVCTTWAFGGISVNQRYRLSRLPLQRSEGTANHTTPMSLIPGRWRGRPPCFFHIFLCTLVLVTQLLGFHAPPLSGGIGDGPSFWRPHYRRRRCRRLRSLRRVPHVRVALCSFVKYLCRWPMRGSYRRSRSIFRRSARRRHCPLRARVAHLPVFRCSRCSRCRPVHWPWRPHSRRGRIPVAAAASEDPATSSVATLAPPPPTPPERPPPAAGPCVSAAASTSCQSCLLR